MLMKRIWRAAAPALACVLLSGCFLQPGKFESALDLRKDGAFTFTYKGQIYLLALSKIADLANKRKSIRERLGLKIDKELELVSAIVN